MVEAPSTVEARDALGVEYEPSLEASPHD